LLGLILKNHVEKKVKGGEGGEGTGVQKKHSKQERWGGKEEKNELGRFLRSEPARENTRGRGSRNKRRIKKKEKKGQKPVSTFRGRLERTAGEGEGREEGHDRAQGDHERR